MKNNLRKIIFATVFALGVCMLPSDVVVAETVDDVSSNDLPIEENVQNQLPNEETEQPIVEAEASGIAINATNFPDENFRNYIKSHRSIDVNQDGYLSAEEIANTNAIEVSNMNVSSMKGIEFFTNLEWLYCDRNNLKSLDVSANKKLIALECFENEIQVLDLSMLPELERLACENNALTSLDLSHNPKLQRLDCGRNNLTSLNVSQNVNLTDIICYFNQLRTLDVKNLKNLETLSCGFNHLKQLDISQNTKLDYLGCGDNLLTTLDLRSNTLLKTVYCENNCIVDLKLDNCKQLERLECQQNQLTSLNVASLPNLNWLNCNENPLTALDVSKNPKLTYLACCACGITSLDLSHNTALTRVYATGNDLSHLDVSMLPKLTELTVNGAIINSGTSIDMTQFAGFDMSRVSNVKQMTINGNTFVFEKLPGTDNYYNGGEFTYDCGNGYKMQVRVQRIRAGLSPVEKIQIKNFVVRLYDVCLGRKPDGEGLSDWRSQLEYKQRTGTTAAYGFVFSQEFRNHNYCNQCYVEHLYQAFMGREADAAGLADWINKLNHGMTREEVFNGFAMSTEFHNLCNSYGILQGEAIAVPATGTFATGPCTGCDKGDGVGDFVTRLYQVCLDRNPDQAGKDDWCGKLWTRQTTGETTAFGFVFSEEFTNRGLDNSTFVDYMYKAFFGRNPDAPGKAYWLEQMSAGMSREDVVKGFTGSEEFFNLCGKYGIIAK